MKIGFFGGCFNPPTNAHLNLVKFAKEKCKLDKVVFVPVGDSYHKKDLAKAKHRYNMLNILCKDETGLEVSDMELKTNKELFAIDAFELIEKQYLNDDIYFIMGADNFINITNWKGYNELVTKYNYIVFDRKYIDINTFINTNELLKENKNKIQIVENLNYKDSCATDIRKSIKEKNVKNNGLISKEILEYILNNNVY